MLKNMLSKLNSKSLIFVIFYQLNDPSGYLNFIM